MLNKLKKGDNVIAVTFLDFEGGEWENHYLWEKYIEAQKTAGKKGASVTNFHYKYCRAR